MSAEEGMSGAVSPRDGLAEQLRHLEDFVARAEADGEALPPEAMEMIARLKEIMQALDGLTSSMGLAAELPGKAEDTPGTGQS